MPSCNYVAELIAHMLVLFSDPVQPRVGPGERSVGYALWYVCAMKALPLEQGSECCRYVRRSEDIPHPPVW